MTSDTLDQIQEALQQNPKDIPLYFDQIFKMVLESSESLQLLRLHQSQVEIQSMQDVLLKVPEYTAMLEGNSDHENMLEALGMLLTYFGPLLHKPAYLSPILTITENCFNSPNQRKRIQVFSTWKRLILNFSLGDHLSQPKRIRLLMIPITNCLQFEKSKDHLKSCIETWAFLLHVFSTKRIQLPNFFKEIVEPCFKSKVSDFVNPMIVQVVANLIGLNNSTSNVFQVIDLPFEDLVTHINGFYRPDQWSVSDLSSLFAFFTSLQFLQSNEYQTAVLSLWDGLISRIAIGWDRNEDVVSNVKSMMSYLSKHLDHPWIHIFLERLGAIRIPERTLAKNDEQIIQILVKGIERVLSITITGSAPNQILKTLLQSLNEKVPRVIGRKLDILPQRDTLPAFFNNRGYHSSPLAPKKVEPQMKRQKTEYIDVPMKPKPNIISTHHLQKLDSASHLENQRMINSLIEQSNTKQVLKDHIQQTMSNLNAIESMDVKELVELQRNLVSVMSAVTNKLSQSM